MRRLLLSVAVAVLATLAVAGPAAVPAYAHGQLVDGSPGPGDDLAPGGALVRLDFRALDAEGPAHVALLDADDSPLRTGDAVVTGDTVCARSAPLSEGVHTLEYLVTAEDGHRLTGRYLFEVTADGGAPAVDACKAVDLPAAEEARTLSEMASSGPSPWLVYGGASAITLLLLAAILRTLRQRRDGAGRAGRAGHAH